ncbi:hypothetical protein NE237_012507 [Protea cynaroides]|uniref:Uncharacterized protein n=1 Tax=Protea cynaroides TaxID=273540 RepID=A0A9Q0GY35_9MAGN|nr:hypothetical protein NE237_012507 [Protea cynaroides]
MIVPRGTAEAIKGLLGSDPRASAEFNSMSTRGLRRPLKGYVRDSRRRKMVLDVDLNDTPPGEGRAPEENFTGIGSQEAQSSAQGGALPPAAPIDVEAIDDEVVISSPRSFAEARNKSRRNHGASLVLDEESNVNQGNSGYPINRFNGHYKRRRVPPNQTIINCELYINLEGNSNTKNEKKPPEPPIAPPPPPPLPPLPKEPTFNCPVCIGPLVEEMSTKCGHIFSYTYPSDLCKVGLQRQGELLQRSLGEGTRDEHEAINLICF